MLSENSSFTSAAEKCAALTLEESVDRSIQSLQIFILTFLRQSLHTINKSLFGREKNELTFVRQLGRFESDLWCLLCNDVKVDNIDSGFFLVSVSLSRLEKESWRASHIDHEKKKCDDTKTSTDRTYHSSSRFKALDTIIVNDRLLLSRYCYLSSTHRHQLKFASSIFFVSRSKNMTIRHRLTLTLLLARWQVVMKRKITFLFRRVFW